MAVRLLLATPRYPEQQPGYGEASGQRVPALTSSGLALDQQLAAVYTVTGTMAPSCYEGPPAGIPTCDLPAADNKCLKDAGTGGRG